MERWDYVDDYMVPYHELLASKDFMKRSALALNIEEKVLDPGKVQQHGLLIKQTTISRSNLKFHMFHVNNLQVH